MRLTPRYASAAAQVLKSDTISDRLWDAIVDAIELICDSPDGLEARRSQLRGAGGKPYWKVSVRTDDDWCILWWPHAEFADIYYVGPL
jgi:hypothetical protein